MAVKKQYDYGLIGLNSAMTELNGVLSKKKGATLAGLFAAGLTIEAEAKRNVPVLTGNLKGSGYTRVAMDDPNAVEVGFSADYAVHVHEDLTAHHDNGDAKFLEHAVTDKMDEVIQIVAAYGKKG